jgi:hypothetical protein
VDLNSDECGLQLIVSEPSVLVSVLPYELTTILIQPEKHTKLIKCSFNRHVECEIPGLIEIIEVWSRLIGEQTDSFFK